MACLEPWTIDILRGLQRSLALTEGINGPKVKESGRQDHAKREANSCVGYATN